MKKINCKCHEDVDIAVGGVLSRKGCCLAEHDWNTRALVIFKVMQNTNNVT